MECLFCVGAYYPNFTVPWSGHLLLTSKFFLLSWWCLWCPAHNDFHLLVLGLVLFADPILLVVSILMLRGVTVVTVVMALAMVTMWVVLVYFRLLLLQKMALECCEWSLFWLASTMVTIYCGSFVRIVVNHGITSGSLFLGGRWQLGVILIFTYRIERGV